MELLVKVVCFLFNLHWNLKWLNPSNCFCSDYLLLITILTGNMILSFFLLLYQQFISCLLSKLNTWFKNLLAGLIALQRSLISYLSLILFGRLICLEVNSIWIILPYSESMLLLMWLMSPLKAVKQTKENIFE